MSFYTSYILSVRDATQDRFAELQAYLKKKELIAYVFEDASFNESTDKEAVFFSWDQQKWYEHEEDMLEISVKFPEMTFQLYCFGEDDSHWKEYYQNGISEECVGRLVFDKPETIQWAE